MTFHLFFVIMQFNNRQVMDEQERLEKVIAKCEEFYCNRLTELVDRKMIDEAGAIFEEFVVEGEEPDDWFFFKVLDENSIEGYYD